MEMKLSLAVLTLFEKVAEVSAGLDREEALRAVFALEADLDESERVYLERLGLQVLHALQDDRGEPPL
jgi:hypothetical protein